MAPSPPPPNSLQNGTKNEKRDNNSITSDAMSHCVSSFDPDALTTTRSSGRVTSSAGLSRANPAATACNAAASEMMTDSKPAAVKSATKPTSFQSREDALRVLRQRRRARAAEAWKQKLQNGSHGGGETANSLQHQHQTDGDRDSEMSISSSSASSDEGGVDDHLNVNGSIEEELFEGKEREASSSNSIKDAEEVKMEAELTTKSSNTPEKKTKRKEKNQRTRQRVGNKELRNILDSPSDMNAVTAGGVKEGEVTDEGNRRKGREKKRKKEKRRDKRSDDEEYMESDDDVPAKRKPRSSRRTMAQSSQSVNKRQLRSAAAAIGAPPQSSNSGVGNNNIKSDISGNGKNNVNDVPLMDLWRRERQRKKVHSAVGSGGKKRERKRSKTPVNDRVVRLDGSNSRAGGARTAAGGPGARAQGESRGGDGARKRDRLFRHVLVLPDELRPPANEPSFRAAVATAASTATGDGKEEENVLPEGRLPSSKLHRRKQSKSRRNGRKANNGRVERGQNMQEEEEYKSLWDIWDSIADDMSLGGDVEEEEVEIDRVGNGGDGGIGEVEIQSRSLPKKGRHGHELEAGTDLSSNIRRFQSLHGRIEKADALIQSKAPCYIEFGARRWMDRPSSGTIMRPSAPLTAREAEESLSLPSHARNRNIIQVEEGRQPINYQSQQTFLPVPPIVTTAPRSKSYACSNAAREFLTALCSAANPGDGITGRTNSAIVMEFLSIIKETRTAFRPASEASPFVLMKKVWALILSAVCNANGASTNDKRDDKSRATLAKEVAAKFDVFLPEGYSMVSRSLLIMGGGLGHVAADATNVGVAAATSINRKVMEGCARTDRVYCEHNISVGNYCVRDGGAGGEEREPTRDDRTWKTESKST